MMGKWNSGDVTGVESHIVRIQHALGQPFALARPVSQDLGKRLDVLRTTPPKLERCRSGSSTDREMRPTSRDLNLGVSPERYLSAKAIAASKNRPNRPLTPSRGVKDSAGPARIPVPISIGLREHGGGANVTSRGIQTDDVQGWTTNSKGLRRATTPTPQAQMQETRATPRTGAPQGSSITEVSSHDDHSEDSNRSLPAETLPTMLTYLSATLVYINVLTAGLEEEELIGSST